MISIESYSQEWESRHVIFASKYWTKKRRKDPEYIYWKFRGNRNEKIKSFILAVENGEVVGQLGLVPCRINIDNIIYDAQWACDLMVDTQYRGKNVAKMLYDYAHKITPITLGSDPSPAASKSMKKSGYSSLKGSWKHLFPITIGEIFKLKGYNSLVLDNIPNPFLLFFITLNKLFKINFKKFVADDYLTLEPSDKLKSTIFVQRDSDFVAWRFNSFLSYYSGIEIHACANKKVVFSGYFSGNSYYVTDYKVNGIFQLCQIIAFLINRYSLTDLKRIRFCCNQENISKYLVFFGFIKFRTQTEIIYFSNDFSIVEKFGDKDFYYTFMDSDENI
jgi:hypothetical protein